MDSLELSTAQLKLENARLRQNLGITAKEAFASVVSEHRNKNGGRVVHHSSNPFEMDAETLSFLQKYWT